MKTALTFLLFIAPFLIVAQSSKVTSAKVAYEQGMYDDALEKLNSALENPGSLKDKALGQAWLYKGKALIGQYREAATNRNMEIINGNNLLDAFDCFQKVYEVTEDKSTVKMADGELENLQYSLFSMAIAKMQLQEYAAAAANMKACKLIDQKFPGENTYNYYNVSGQCLLFAGDTVQAARDLTVSKDVYVATPPKTPDFGVGYVYYYLAFIQRYQENDIDKALSTVQEGIATLNNEKQRLDGMRATVDPDVMDQLLASYAQIKNDLERSELDIYNNYPEKYDEALEKFRKAVKENPKDENILLVYGNLLEQKDEDAGLEVYKQVLELNPNNTTALFNAGANRVNKGVAYAHLANEEIDWERSTAWQEKVDEQFRLALPYLEKCTELDPDNSYVLDALLQVTIQLNEMDKYAMYKEKRDALRGY